MNRSNSALALISIGLLIIFITTYTAAAEPSVYRVLVDDWYGFYKVSGVNASFKYENQTLIINAGDTVIWINDATDNSELTILSVQNLWDSERGYLKYNYRSFNYTFMQPGTYEIYVKEYPRRPHQTIIVTGVVTPTATTPTLTPTVTETVTVTATVIPNPVEKAPEINLWYILLALLLVIGIVALIYSQRKK